MTSSGHFRLCKLVSLSNKMLNVYSTRSCSVGTMSICPGLNRPAQSWPVVALLLRSPLFSFSSLNVLSSGDYLFIFGPAVELYLTLRKTLLLFLSRFLWTYVSQAPVSIIVFFICLKTSVTRCRKHHLGARGVVAGCMAMGEHALLPSSSPSWGGHSLPQATHARVGGFFSLS